MHSFTIQDLDPITTSRFRARAEAKRRSVESGARLVLEAALGTGAAPKQTLPQAILPKGNLYEHIHACVALIGGVELDLPQRKKLRTLLRFDCRCCSI